MWLKNLFGSDSTEHPLPITAQKTHLESNLTSLKVVMENFHATQSVSNHINQLMMLSSIVFGKPPKSK